MLNALVQLVACVVFLVCMLVWFTLAYRGVRYRDNRAFMHVLGAVTIIAALLYL